MLIYTNARKFPTYTMIKMSYIYKASKRREAERPLRD